MFRFPYRRSLTLMLSLLLWALALSVGAQNKTLTERPIADAPSFTKRALVIGIGQYEHAGSLVATTYNDALRFADLLKTQFKFPEEAITLLTDAPGTPDSRRPTYIHLLNAVETLLARALLIVDACRSLSGNKDAVPNDFGTSKGLTGPQFAELLSCRPKEESKVGKPEDFTESVFTHFLLQGLKGDADAQDKGVVTFDSLNEYVQGRVSQYVSNKFGEAQNPDGRASLGKMILARPDGKAIAAAPVEQAAIKLLDTQAALTITSDPPGADVIVDGKPVGKTPFTLTRDLGLDEKKTVRIGLSQNGYQARSFDVDLTRGKTLATPAIVLRPLPANPGIAVAKFKKNSKDDADMVFIPAGEFMMGSPPSEIDALVKQYNADFFKAEGPQHKVMLDGYYIYRTPVTVAQYLKFCDETGYARPPAPDFNPNWSKLGHPIVNVSYNDALAYCEWAGVKLPTEAQWEKAARGMDGRQYPWGNAFDRSNLWASESKAGGTKPVGSFPSGASPFGVLDMAGNVGQWCSDWYDPNFYSNRLATDRNPENQSVGEKKYRVLRGGSWSASSPLYFRSAYRLYLVPDDWILNIGFRCVSGF